MFDTRMRRLFLFACLKDAPRAGAALKNAALAPGSDTQKICSGGARKVAALGGSGSPTLMSIIAVLRIRIGGIRTGIISPDPDLDPYQL